MSNQQHQPPMLNNDLYAPSTSMAHNTAASAYLFTSEMINTAATQVMNGKSESIFAWHEQNVQPSTSDGMDKNGRSLKRKSSTNEPLSAQYSNGSAAGMRPPSVHDMQNQNGKSMNSAIDDNPLRKMEKMTQESSLFQPPTKKPNCDYAPGMNIRIKTETPS
ncbi:hypothetical protein L596_006326 [Steinernema carpocapsae]|uniref:Uncharacterized protein n=1 Tax=Steinernema carpocapsae TaxID=34508 RepID=A0A4V6I8Y2_STECR|nr:hypothetical protein L596_006326 [Steinernema carpocapsae]